MRRYIQFLGNRCWILVVLFIVVMFATYLGLKIPLYLKQIIDIVSKNRYEEYSTVLNLVYLIISLKLFIWFITRAKEYVMTILLVKSNSILRNKAFEYTLHHSHTFFANSFSGSLAKKINDYSSSFQGIIFQLETVILPLLVQLTGASIIIFSVNKKIGLLFILGSIFIVLYNIVSAILKMKYDKPASDAMSRIVGFNADSISGNNAILVFSAEDHELTLRETVEKSWRKKKLRQWLFGDTIFTIQAFLFILFEFFILKYSILGWSLGTVTSGEFVLFQFYVVGSFTYLNSLGFSIRMIYEAYADAREMVEILETPHEVQDVPGAKELTVREGKIVFDKVTFSYNENNEALSDLNVEIIPGQKIGLIGPSGAGKSTFVKLLLRFFDVTTGSIQIDGQNIKEVTQDSLHNAIGFVPQDPALFHRSLMDNIRYGRRDATDEEVVEASKKAHAHEFISSLPEGYNTLVGERGIKLSGGERQRVAIARAILKNAPILVLDEATSALDSESERLIQDALNVLMEGKTVMVIAHRLSTIQHMDRILVIDQGCIIEDGDHKKLLKNKKSLYKKLWDLQAGGFIE